MNKWLAASLSKMFSKDYLGKAPRLDSGVAIEF